MSVIVSDSLKAEVTQSIKRFMLMAEKHYGKIYGMPSVSYDLNSNVGGTANYPLWHIQVNPRMLVENKDDYLINTIGHEVAHLITSDNHHGKRMGHKKEWKDTMAVFGLKPERCHNYQTYSKPRKPQKRFLFRCKCRVLHLTATYRRHVEKRQKKLYCTNCWHNYWFSETEQEAGEWRESEKKRLQKEAVRVSNATKNATKKRTKRWLESQANLWMGG